ncbi:MAG: AgmX/PglI C-terminal domain-containing protein [Deltaproteobacteria bacterium]|nr:AgmX/PglI C-terminal domain-containing protein [Deltaproteobacteria bacterium]
MAEEPIMRIPLRTCVRCGKPIVAGMKECFSCGAPVDEEKKPDDQLIRCPTCGKELVRGAAVCSLCGTRLRPERAAAVTSAARPAPIPLTTLESAGPSSPFPSLEKGSFLGMTRRMGLRLGTVMFLLFGFLGGKLLFRGSSTDPPAVVPPPLSSPTSPSPPESVPPPVPPSPSLEVPAPARTFPKGRVVTADGLGSIRVFGPGMKEATRTTTVLRERVEEFLPSIRNVYSERLTPTQQLLGTLVLELAITPEGHVSQVEIHATAMENQEFAQIVRSLVQEWRFEPAAGATTVFYPLLFTPTELDPFSLIGLTRELLPGRYRMVGGGPVPVRVRPNDGGAEVGKVSPGLRVDIVGSQQGWLAVLSPKGKVGYIRRDALFPRSEEGVPSS